MGRIEYWSSRICTPQQAQAFLRTFQYNPTDTLRSAEECLRIKAAHCLEGAFVAAALLEKHGYPPLVVSMESQDDVDHVIYVFKEKQLWGAIAQSRDEGLHGRRPVFRSLRDLVWSYFDAYIDLTGRMTAYQIADLDESGANWRRSHKNVWKAERHLIDLAHIPLISSDQRYQKWRRRHQEGRKLIIQPTWW